MPSLMCKQLPFLFLCVFWGISPSKRTLVCYAKRTPQSYMFPHSHGNISFLRNGKEARKSKESPLCKGMFSNSCVLLRFGNTLGLMLSSASPSGEHARMGTSPSTKGGNTILVLKAPYSHISCSQSLQWSWEGKPFHFYSYQTLLNLPSPIQ